MPGVKVAFSEQEIWERGTDDNFKSVAVASREQQWVVFVVLLTVPRLERFEHVLVECKRHSSLDLPPLAAVTNSRK